MKAVFTAGILLQAISKHLLISFLVQLVNCTIYSALSIGTTGSQISIVRQDADKRNRKCATTLIDVWLANFKCFKITLWFNGRDKEEQFLISKVFSSILHDYWYNEKSTRLITGSCQRLTVQDTDLVASRFLKLFMFFNIAF